MSDNDPNNDWIASVKKPKIDENEKFEMFYIKYYKPRIFKGWNPESASRDAPEGFSEWLKSNKRMIK